jgi:hypothetical protein
VSGLSGARATILTRDERFYSDSVSDRDISGFRRGTAESSDCADRFMSRDAGVGMDAHVGKVPIELFNVSAAEPTSIDRQ